MMSSTVRAMMLFATFSSASAAQGVEYMVYTDETCSGTGVAMAADVGYNSLTKTLRISDGGTSAQASSSDCSQLYCSPCGDVFFVDWNNNMCSLRTSDPASGPPSGMLDMAEVTKMMNGECAKVTFKYGNLAMGSIKYTAAWAAADKLKCDPAASFSLKYPTCTSSVPATSYSDDTCATAVVNGSMSLKSWRMKGFGSDPDEICMSMGAFGSTELVCEDGVIKMQKYQSGWCKGSKSGSQKTVVAADTTKMIAGQCVADKYNTGQYMKYDSALPCLANPCEPKGSDCPTPAPAPTIPANTTAQPSNTKAATANQAPLAHGLFAKPLIMGILAIVTMF
jgi:hypothetical protein